MSQRITTPKIIKTTSSNNTTGIGRMLLLSLVLHALILVILGGFIVPRIREVKKPVYYVDLLHKPVAKPRAGRTDAVAVKKKTRVKKKVRKPVKPIIPPHKSQTPVKKAVVKVAPPKNKQPVAPVVTDKPSITPVKIVEPSDPMDAIAKMRRHKRIADLKNQLASLAHDPMPPSVDAPVGVVGGRGSQAGVDFDSWIKAYLSEAWVLPSHYLQRGLKAKMLLRFNRHGRLIYHEMLIPSGDSFFDASIKRAVQQLQQLPSEPEGQMDLTVTFDPREMLVQ